MRLVPRQPSQELVNLVGTLGGTWHGLTAMCHCPAHDDHTPSLSLRQGDRGVVVTCFAGCDRKDVLRELGRVRPAHNALPYTPMPAARRANIDRLWQQAVPASEGLGGRYLTRRHFGQVPRDLRYHPRCPHGPRPRTIFKPALLVAVREGCTLVAVQRIFLDPRTADRTAKVMLGTPLHGAWRGRDAGSCLAIAEGFESAEAFALLNGLPCWASLGARRLDQLNIPGTVSTLLIAEDSDAEGRRASLRACGYYERPGLVVRRAPPPAPFKDWAEVLDDRAKRGGGTEG